MGCCGKIKNIATGYTNLVVDKKYIHTDDRIRACHKCDEQTWLSAKEYSVWLLKNGIDIVKNFNQLDTLDKLPKYKQSKDRRKLFCRICKCFIPAKARVEKEKCPKDNWN